ncbi:uncharacterized protein LAESUDRAFT_305484 [Laetiporus sulphureus 93-53]|uniref:Uncharacterized protein n=1 Tax=Laetiporus sulphureus 93-53 TaxID=1314785 RepID=A0A165D8N6_9APHY|nr:uncharacterized protein LAESUDRAFT_305484 [Laetiporus sulphureus 93-53]KZT04341.1 hypothetical protein LAESUDRAFT_305484 [Laetiporus sulphureus 93-53]
MRYCEIVCRAQAGRRIGRHTWGPGRMSVGTSVNVKTPRHVNSLCRSLDIGHEPHGDAGWSNMWSNTERHTRGRRQSHEYATASLSSSNKGVWSGGRREGTRKARTRDAVPIPAPIPLCRDWLGCAWRVSHSNSCASKVREWYLLEGILCLSIVLCLMRTDTSTGSMRHRQDQAAP